MNLVRLVKTLVLAASCVVLLNGCDGSENDAPFLSWQTTGYQKQARSNPTTPTVWQSMSQKFALNHNTFRPAVMREIRKYQSHQGALYQVLQQGAPYIYYVYEQTVKKNLPAEIALLPVIESEFDPKARSYVGATGLWQLMPATATAMGVKINSAYDGRSDIVASTDAALSYLSDLGNMFKSDWYLAIASYNCGQGKVLYVKKGRRSWFGQSLYWSLPLPQQTREYVPKLLALAEIIQNPKKYGVKLPEIENAPKLATVKVDNKVDLAKAAETAGVSLQTIKALNPGYKSTKLTVKGTLNIVIPVEKATNFANNSQYEVSLPKPAEENPTVNNPATSSETLSMAETPVHTDQVLLVAFNKQTYEKLMVNTIAWLKQTLPDTDENMQNSILAQNNQTTPVVIQDKSTATAAPATVMLAQDNHDSSIKPSTIIYRVQKNDSLSKIAKRYSVSVNQLRQWNNLKRTKLKHGEKIVIYDV